MSDERVWIAVSSRISSVFVARPAVWDEEHTESSTLPRAQSPVAIHVLPPDASTDDESEVGELLCEAARLLTAIQRGRMRTYLEA